MPARHRETKVVTDAHIDREINLELKVLQQQLSQEGSCERYAHALLPYLS